MTSNLNTIMLAALMLLTVTSVAAVQDNWYAQSSGTNEYLFDVHFADADNGWAVGYNGEIVHTSPIPPETVSANLGCLPGSGVLPFTVSIQAELGNNVFTQSVRDVTPAPFNQPPYPASEMTPTSIAAR